MRSRTALFTVVAVFTTATQIATAQTTRARETESATTRHQSMLNGKPLRYTARVGLIPIIDNDAGKTHGHFSYTAYTLERAAGQPPRPVMFIWNGGPGANSTTVHFVGFGPRRLRSPDNPARPTGATPLEFYDNDATWLEFADLVFVDPVGTGFSRPAKPEYAAEFYNTLGDLASTAEFVRVYLTRFDLLMSPVFLAGESYGTWRASGAAEALERKGFHVAGVVLISGGVQMGKVSPDAVRTALFIANRTATAFFHKKLAPDLMRDERATLKEAQAWALSTYAPAWDRRDSLTDAERDQVIAQLARYTGVEPSSIDRKTLAMTSPQFTSTLLRDRGLTLGRYDMRITQPVTAGRGDGATPAADGGASRNSLMMHYFRDEPAASRAGAASVGSGDGPPGGSQPWLRRAMDLNSRITVFVAAGEYDSLNSCADNGYLVSQLEPKYARNFTIGCYGGGHMMYDTKDARFTLKRDMAAFVGKTVAAFGR